MAVKLGNMEQNIKLQNLKVDNEKQSRIMTINKLLSNIEELGFAQMVCDIYDTYWYIRKTYGEDDFSKGLWKFLIDDKNGLSMNSYFSFDANCTSSIGIGRFGVCIYYSQTGGYLMTDEPDLKNSSCDKNVWRGKYLLKDYIGKFDVDVEHLDRYIRGLESIILNFKRIHDEFFELVDKHKIYI